MCIPFTAVFGQSGDEKVKYDVVGAFRDDGYAQVKLNGKVGLINKSGNEVIPCKYNQIQGAAVIYKNGYASVYFSEGFACVLSDRWGYVDESGKEIAPFIYNDIRPFSDGMGRVKLDSKCGYVDKSGNEVIPLKYDEASDFSGGITYVSLEGKTMYIDQQGNEYDTKKAAQKAVKKAKGN